MAGDYTEPNHEHNWYIIRRETIQQSEQTINVYTYQCRCGAKKDNARAEGKTD